MAQKIQYMSDVPPHGNIVRFIGEVEGGPEGRAIFISVISMVVAQRCYVHETRFRENRKDTKVVVCPDV